MEHAHHTADKADRGNHHHHHHDHDHHLSWWLHLLFLFFTGFAALSTAIITGVAMFLAFPAWGIPFAILIGLSGAFTEAAVFYGAVKEGIEDIYRWQFFKQLEHRIRRNWLVHEKVAAKEITEAKTLDVFERRNIAQAVDKANPHHTHEKNNESNETAILNEIKIKKVLLVLVILWSIANGIGFGAITYTHTAMALAGFIGIGGMSLLPIGWMIFAAILAVCAAFSWALVMYHTLFHAVSDNFFLKIYHFFCRLCALPQSIEKPTGWDHLLYAVKILAKFLMFLFVLGTIATCALASLASGGAWSHACIVCFQPIMGLFIASGFSSALILVFVLPVFFFFSIKNILVLIEFFLDVIVHGDFWNKESLTERKPAQPWTMARVGFYIGVGLAITLFILHVFGAAAVGGEVTDSKFMGIFMAISKFFNHLFGVQIITPVAVALTVTGVPDLADSVFVTNVKPLGGDEDGHNHGWLPPLIEKAGAAIDSSCCTEKNTESGFSGDPIPLSSTDISTPERELSASGGREEGMPVSPSGVVTLTPGLSDH